MTDLTVIILVGNEELHIRRCIERLKPLRPRQIIVVESQKGDGTHGILEQLKDEMPEGVSLEPVFHEWPGNQAAQFNWAIDSLPVAGEWVLRLDADEYLVPETIERLLTWDWPKSGVDGYLLELRRRFLGGEIRHATNGIRKLRLFRRGRGRYAETQMDERIEVEGETADFPGAFYDDNLNGFDWWREKHRGYAKREAAQYIAFRDRGEAMPDPRKASYYRLPPYFRALAYFGVRYFLRGGFLDGAAGWRWNFWQGLWYRWLCDREIAKFGKGGAK